MTPSSDALERSFPAERIHIVPRKRGRRLRTLALGSMGLGMVLVAIVAALPGHGAAETVFALAAAWALALVPALLVLSLVAERLRRPARNGTLAVENETLTIKTPRAAQSIPFDSIASGWLLQQPRSQRVEIELRDGNVLRAQVADGTALIAQLGLDARRRALRVPLRGMLGAFTRGLLAVTISPMLGGLLITLLEGLSLPHNSILPIWALFSFGALLAGLKLTRTPSVVVGADGLTLESGVRARFIPYKNIESVNFVYALPPALGGTATALPHIDVACVGGRHVSLPLVAFDDDRRDALLARIREAKARADASGTIALHDLLARGERTFDAWVHDLRALRSPTAGYRRVQVTSDELVRVVEDAQATEEQRVAAAIALSSTTGEVDPRVRVAAGASANETLRVALESVADGTATERALAAAVRTRA